MVEPCILTLLQGHPGYLHEEHQKRADHILHQRKREIAGAKLKSAAPKAKTLNPNKHVHFYVSLGRVCQAYCFASSTCTTASNCQKLRARLKSKCEVSWFPEGVHDFDNSSGVSCWAGLQDPMLTTMRVRDHALPPPAPKEADL